MRPDEHKSKESRKYQARKKLQGDTEAAETAEARRRASRARDKGQGVAAIRRRNGEASQRQEQSKSSTNFSRRKITNEMALDAELGIDRETTDLVAMLEETDEISGGGTSYFKFKEEQLWETDTIQKEELYKNMLQVNFDLFEGVMQQMDTRTLLGLSEEDADLVDSAYADVPIRLDKPIVPAFAKNAKGLVLFKSSVVVEKKEQDGIYLRNDGSNHRVQSNQVTKPQEDGIDESDELDELLALDSKNSAVTNERKPPLAKSVTTLPKPTPGRPSLKKPVIPSSTTMPEKDDEAWLDDLLG
ncbi:hypothetical protein DFQ30_005297 [Apophysomyces sp. BC1015]|nr:hypothetical protein DFQ30_005297 [Apophysomyces sp. BC1015]